LLVRHVEIGESLTGREVMQLPLAIVAMKGTVVSRFRSDEEGQDLLEYAFLVALIALVAIGAVSSVGQAVHTFFWENIAQQVANNF
jgi:Flp pilus assembly pilin Flp